ncbi:phage tail protein [Escherichia coli]|uniref:phage tail-collar fiber domain-containing protein n=1 Tax=Escherichia coli TaxID=562 RepID=UPI000B7CFE79|nr:phage tail protein [Escherichia coli]
MAENKIYAVLTDRGTQLEAAALASGVPVVLNKFVIGDASGNDDVTPDPARTALIHETYCGDIKSAENSGNQVIFTLYVPPETGGYTIREVGILTDKDELYSVARSPDVLKPTESNGALISVTYKYTLAVSSTSTVTVVINNNSMNQDDADKRYLQISKNLDEIKKSGTAAQKTARENLGIKLEDYYTKTEIDSKFTDINNDIDDLQKIKPVLSVNDIKPDDNGNVKVNVGGAYPKINGDGAYIFAMGGSGAIGENVKASRLNPAYTEMDGASSVDTLNGVGPLAGIWTRLATVPSVGVNNGATLWRRVPVGDVAKLSEIKIVDKILENISQDIIGYQLQCNIEGVGNGVVFTARPGDPEDYGKQLYSNAQAGLYPDESGTVN